jgi:seryl-tRNA(sec) selenium transferase
MKNPSEILRFLPAVETLLQTEKARAIAAKTGARRLTALARSAVEATRRGIQDKIAVGEMPEATREELLREAEKALENLWQAEDESRLRKVINATGVIVHTNLGRAPLSENARKKLFEEAAGYCNLEYDLSTGRRGRRGARAEKLLAEITGAESALIVNNCAAAAFLVLTALAAGGEVIVSRGELVEIGGDFRVPDVLAQSGAILREVGTTNRTKLADYERAVNENTRVILRVHPSNYRIVGFTSTPELKELAELAHNRGLILFEDAGSGALTDLSPYGLVDEPLISRSLASGADIVTFSGDKLAGGVQAGLIVGKREYIEILRKHPLYRALRVDKLIYAALEATFESFLCERAFEEIPVLKMLSMSKGELEKRTRNFASKLRESLSENSSLKFEIVEGKSIIGGGSAPLVQPESFLLALEYEKMSASRLEETLRRSNPPVIVRILEDKVLLDLRTVAETEEPELLKVLTNLQT